MTEQVKWPRGVPTVSNLLAAMGREAEDSFRRYMGSHHYRLMIQATNGELDANGFERELYLAAGRFFASYHPSKST